MKKLITTFVIVCSFISLFSFPQTSLDKQNRENPPSATDLRYPAMDATEVTESPLFAWQPSQGLLSGYKFFLGTDGNGTVSPSSLVNGIDLGNVLTYYPNLELELNQTYYWQIIPYHLDNGDAQACPIWSFQTKAESSLPNPYRNFLNGTSSFSGNIVTSIDGGIQASLGGLTSAFSGEFQTNNAIGVNSSNDQLVFYYRLSEYQLGNSASQDPNFLTTYISYDKINFLEINSLSCFDENLNNQYNKVTIDLTNYPGTYYVKFSYNLYHFYETFFGTSNNPELYIDNFFIRENNNQRVLSVSPPSINIENGVLNRSYNEDVVVTNYSTSQVSIENLHIAQSPISTNFFTLNSQQSVITMNEGYSYSFSIGFYANEYGYISTALTYEYSEDGGVSISDPTHTLMILTANCPNPHIISFPYLQDFSQWPPPQWQPGPWHQTIDDNNKSWATSPVIYDIAPFPYLLSPSFLSYSQMTIQFKLSVPSGTHSFEPFTVQIGQNIGNYSLANIVSLDSFTPNQYVTQQYNQGILINDYIIKTINIPNEYIGVPFRIIFDYTDLGFSNPQITDFKIFPNNGGIAINLEEPQLSIGRENSYNVLRWEHIPFVDNYQIEACNDIMTNNWYLLETTPYQAYIYTGNENYKFFRVRALSNSLP